jgi:predicted lipoprotein with Yx(FWY)xxD motif
MTMRTRIWAVSGAIVAAALLAACGQKTGGTSGGGSGSSPMAEHIGTRSISGVGTVLDDAQGLTLYHLKTETNGHIQCTGSCASTWPPLLAAGGTAPAAPSGVSGTFGTVKRPDGGTQLTFDGWPLYTYSGDTGPGQANGQGIQGVWFAVTTSAKSGGASSGGHGGYGGGY